MLACVFVCVHTCMCGNTNKWYIHFCVTLRECENVAMILSQNIWCFEIVFSHKGMFSVFIQFIDFFFLNFEASSLSFQLILKISGILF